MNHQYILGIELKALGRREVTEDIQTIPIIKLYLDESGNYHFATGIKEIEIAILGTIPHLAEIYRHPLLFEIQILPGDREDAYLAALDAASFSSKPRRRKRIDPN